MKAPRYRRSSVGATAPFSARLVGSLLLGLAFSAACTGDRDDPASEANEPTLIEQATAWLREEEPAEAASLIAVALGDGDGNEDAWLVLGTARRRSGDLGGAAEAYERAAADSAIAPRAWRGLAAVRAQAGETDAAFAALRELHGTGKFAMTMAGLDPALEPLERDPRFAELLPSADQLADPFVEPVAILHEWRGEAAGDAFGWIARNAGDLDGDGLPDVVTSATGNDQGGEEAGKVYAYSSSGRLLWEQRGEAGWELGTGVESAGDTDGDGVADVAAGAPGGDRSFVYSGRDGSTLLELVPDQDEAQFGRHLEGVGDWNGDGRSDVLVGAPLHDGGGEDAGLAVLFSGADGSVLWRLEGEAGEQLGTSVAGSGRFLLVGAPEAREGKGVVYVFDQLGTEPRAVIEPEESAASLGGMFLSVVGDVDADGIDDLYASDWGDLAHGPTTGRIYVHSGADGRRLLTLTGETGGEGFGIGPADAGDVDGDGHDDLVIGSWQYAGAAPSGGRVGVYSGADGSLVRAITCKVPGDTFGFDATGMGDLDGDGVPDLLLTSAWSAVAGPRAGRVFLVSGAE